MTKRNEKLAANKKSVAVSQHLSEKRASLKPSFKDKRSSTNTQKKLIGDINQPIDTITSSNKVSDTTAKIHTPLQLFSINVPEDKPQSIGEISSTLTGEGHNRQVLQRILIPKGGSEPVKKELGSLSFRDILKVINRKEYSAIYSSNFGVEGEYSNIGTFLLNLETFQADEYNQLVAWVNMNGPLARNMNEDLFDALKREEKRIMEIQGDNSEAIIDGLSQVAILIGSVASMLKPSSFEKAADLSGFLIGGFIGAILGVIAVFKSIAHKKESMASRLWEGAKGGATALMGGLYAAAGFAAESTAVSETLAKFGDGTGILIVTADFIKQIVEMKKLHKEGKLKGEKLGMHICFMAGDFLVALANGLGLFSLLTAPWTGTLLGLSLVAFILGQVFRYRTRDKKSRLVMDEESLLIN